MISLSPAVPADLSGSAAAAVALAWKLRATEDLLDDAGRSADQHPGQAVPLLAELAQGLESGGTGTNPSSKKQKIESIGGVPLYKATKSDAIELGGFRTGVGGNPIVLPSQLGPYPGRASSLPMLRVPEILGPSILLGLVQEGVNVELAVRGREWKRGSNGEVLSAEAEALTLSRYPLQPPQPLADDGGPGTVSMDGDRTPSALRDPVRGERRISWAGDPVAGSRSPSGC